MLVVTYFVINASILLVSYKSMDFNYKGFYKQINYMISNKPILTRPAEKLIL